ncbi:MAG: histidine phosphatase family protein [Xanthomonadales bacterium]|nr:histidine phosphatase family protein [Xanthomonadales bacterium]
MTASTLILLRHAKSSWETPWPDANRPLSRRGTRQAPLVARWLARHDLRPDRILCSPAVRCRETLAIFSDILQLPGDLVQFDSRIYEAHLRTLKTVIRPALPDCRCLMVVGHNPGMDSLLLDLSEQSPPRTRKGKLMTTSAVAVLRLGESPMLPGTAQLEALVRPKELLRTSRKQ